ncbi:MAG: hypothetical protein RJB66_1990 [Pseudomonadota bacterium]|jgi:hypothetical protein
MFELSVGSKVFLLGEYQVLHGGAALVVNLEPRFKLVVTAGTGKIEGISESSPAGAYLAQEKHFFESFDLSFVDPHQGRGGFGASTAQLALLMGLRDGLECFKSESQVEFDLRKIHKKYLELATTKTGVPPSGADLLGQIRGGLVEVDVGGGKIQWQAWPFPQWDILFFATGAKQATHEHLSALNQIDLKILRSIYQSTMAAFKASESDLFLQGFKAYQKELAHCGWQASFTGSLLAKINLISGVFAAKGCGAMGADVLAVIVDKKSATSVAGQIESLGVKFIGGLEKRTEGFSYEVISKRLEPKSISGEAPCL